MAGVSTWCAQAVAMSQCRIHYTLQGSLQGVGFRPFVFRLATQLKLTGYVCNTGCGVDVEVQGRKPATLEFEQRLKSELPIIAAIRRLNKNLIQCTNESEFRIIESRAESAGHSATSAEVMPDLAMCEDCARELMDPSDRRFRYPFTHCTNCGPRYSIQQQLPFDRSNTTMASFNMCAECRVEYANPLDRRFHSQANCCAVCGPSLSFKNKQGDMVAVKDAALLHAAAEIRDGRIVAVLGTGGFHLICDARNDAAVQRLRHAKRREAKPFALMVSDVVMARSLCHVSNLEAQLLSGIKAPIVLLKRNTQSTVTISAAVAPGLSSLGILLPYSPLHRLLMEELKFAIVATSGNISEEPICYQESEAIEHLGDVADCFLVHDRVIAARVDDSVVRVIDNHEVVLRAGRGYAPLVLADRAPRGDLLALGGQLKNTLSFSQSGDIVLMPHIGNLESVKASIEYNNVVSQVIGMRRMNQPHLVCDQHPDYYSTRVGVDRTSERSDVKLIKVQHHEAHLLACVAEHQINGEVFGVAWDGTGYGDDGTVWGGEFFCGSSKGFLRVGHLRKFQLIGGEAAVKDPRRATLALLYQTGGRQCDAMATLAGIDMKEASIWLTMLEKELNSPWTSSAGRVFDGIAALLGLSDRIDYEGQAAIGLEELAASWLEQHSRNDCESYPIVIEQQQLAVVDWASMVQGVIEDCERGVSRQQIAAKFHKTLAECIVAMAKRVNIPQVIVSGGCFQNRVLTEWALNNLRDEGFVTYSHHRVPPNDGGISVGQVMGGCNVLVSAR